MIIQIDYPEADVRLDLWGGTSGTFAGLDRFNRVIDQRWQNNVSSTPADIDRYQYGYDRDSNRTWKQNTVGSNFDEFYTYDDLNRLTSMQRGTLTGTPPTGISGTPAKEQDWTLDPLGNWNGFLTKASGTTDLNQSWVHDRDNQIVEIGGTPAWATPPAYDAAGNMNSFPQPNTPANAFGAVYDAWNRLKTVTDGANTVAAYNYDGINERIVKKTYTSGTLTETRHVYYTSNWQDVEERVSTSTTADLQYVWGIRYVDELVCRDDATPARLYACQDANFNLTAITDDAGTVQERYVFEPYGTRAIYSPSWTARSTSTEEWGIGHQGLILDVNTGLIYNRNRMLDPELGRFLQRDPMGYVDGMNLYEYEDSANPRFVDPKGSLCEPPEGDCPDAKKTDAEICANAKTKGWDNNSAGGVICICEGTKDYRQVPCAWLDPVPGETKLISQIKYDCAIAHEKVHVGQNGPCNDKHRATIGNLSPSEAECPAYLAEYQCLRAGLKLCKGDAICEGYIQGSITEVSNELKKFKCKM